MPKDKHGNPLKGAALITHTFKKLGDGNMANAPKNAAINAFDKGIEYEKHRAATEAYNEFVASKMTGTDSKPSATIIPLRKK